MNSTAELTASLIAPHDCTHQDTAPDHHPITREEVIRILAIAAQHKYETVAAVGVRLGQAVVGNTCPRTDGFADDVRDVLEDIYAKNWSKGAEPMLVEDIMSILANTVPHQGKISPTMAERLGKPDLTGAPVQFVKYQAGDRWLASAVRVVDRTIDGDTLVTHTTDFFLLGTDGVIETT